jgi:hypothetical protein
MRYETWLGVPGVKVCLVEELIRPDTGFRLETHIHSGTIVKAVLRELMPSPDKRMPWNSSDRSWAHLFCAATIKGMYADGYIPSRTELPTPEEYTEAIEYVCSSAAEFSELEASTSLPLADLLHHCYNAWQDLIFFKCSDGYVGLATPSVEKGDIVRVLLGLANPVVLRKQPLSGSKTHETWNVINVALVVGLMNGEAIYGDSLLYSAPFPVTRCLFRYLQQRVPSILVRALLRAQIMVARVKVV